MSKAEAERLWYLKRSFGQGGWCNHRLKGVKKWDAVVDKLVRQGFLEDDPYYEDRRMMRITDAGINAIKGVKP